MAVRPVVRDPRARAFNMRALWRLGLWGTSAAAALTLAVVAGYSDTGSRRLMAAAAPPGGTTVAQRAPAAATPQPVARSSETEAETRRLAEAVRALTADRERLATRLGTLERSLEDVTGAIKQQATAASPPPTAPPSPSAAPASAPVKEAALTPAVEESPPAQPPAAMPPAEPQPATADRAVPVEPAGDPPGASSVATRTEFGVDIGGALNFDGLRVLWSSTRGGNATLFEALQPVVVARENSRTKMVELRLVAGPLANAEAATRICATLLSARRYCQPVAYEGQRLAQAAVVPERKPATLRAAPHQPRRSATPFR
jgi:hypothetical protein